MTIVTEPEFVLSGLQPFSIFLIGNCLPYNCSKFFDGTDSHLTADDTAFGSFLMTNEFSDSSLFGMILLDKATLLSNGPISPVSVTPGE